MRVAALDVVVGKRWIPCSEKRLGVQGCAIPTPLPVPSDEPDRSLSAAFYQAVPEFIGEVRRRIRRWEWIAIGTAIVAIIVLALTQHR